ncbi:hypothetical protein [Nocardia terpenica]|uniref:Uncharacterized protein n=1 Tax=Nocardia terpenica TaxID=455432 RepID=A0A164H1C9_9NOCA|nr:hypothetical protein [Nocardia terpenica]KZM68120.1 hypothetical protein AWN90_09265 [Nocardia terpenica]NQE89023.1 hypothetical protein [Nocardia terpenica]
MTQYRPHPDGGYTNTSLSQLARMNQQSVQQQLAQPVLASMNNFGSSVGNFQEYAIDEFGALICRALAGIDILGLKPFGFMTAWADNLDAQAKKALRGSQAAQATANSAVSAIQNQQQQQQTGGNAVTVPGFPPGLSGSLGPGWSLGGDAGTAPWMTDQYGAGMAAQPPRVAVAGRRWALHQTVMATDNHTASTVCGYGDPNSQAYTGLIVRAAPDMSSFVYANVFIHSVNLGYGTYTGNRWTFTDWASIGSDQFLLAAGDTLSLAVSASTYTFSRNATPVLTHTDTIGQVPTGAGTRSVGLLTRQSIDGWGNVTVGWEAASFAAADTSPPQTLGTGWSIFKGSATPSSTGNTGSGWFKLPAGTFDTVRQMANVSFTGFDQGIVKIQKPGWYLVSMGALFPSDTPEGAAAGFSLLPNGASGDQVTRMGYLADTVGAAGGRVYGVAATNIIYLNPGDQLIPALYLAPDSGNYPLKIAGSGQGYCTYFDGALIG